MFTIWGSEDRKVMVYFPAVAARLLWVSRVVPEEGDRTVAVMVVPAGIVDIPSREVKVTVLGYLVACWLVTVMVTEETGERLPALSLAMAVRVWEALVKVVVSKGLLIFPV